MNVRLALCGTLLVFVRIVGNSPPAQAGTLRHRTASASAPILTARREGSRLYLVEGKEHLLLRNEVEAQSSLWRKPQSFMLTNGFSIMVSDTNVFVYKDGKKVGTIAMDAKMKQWLADDTFWKNPAEANEMRHRHKAGIHFQFVLDDVVTEAGSLLGVLGWIDLIDSGEPIRAQQLIRIHATRTPNLEVVRHLDTIWLDPGQHTPRRLFTLGKRLLLYEKSAQNRLVEITPDGKDKRVVAELPNALYPVGIIEKRWLLLRTWVGPTTRPVQICDLRTGKMTALPDGFPKGDADAVVLPQDGHYILIQKYGSDNKERNAIVSIPDGKVVRLPIMNDNGTAFVWHDKVIFTDNDPFKDNIPHSLLIYSAASGNLTKRLRVPDF